MKIEVSATRMELLRLKKRLALAIRGHKLLKDKQDELMKKFLEMIETYKNLRKKVDSVLNDFYQEYYTAISEYSNEKLKSLFLLPNMKVELSAKFIPVMNLRLPQWTLKIEKEKFQFCNTFDFNLQLNYSIKKLENIIPDLIKLSEIENNIKQIANEIEKTKRRVNALEYVLIPNLTETIKYINMKINETERSNLTRLMKVKEIVEKH